MYQKMIYLVFLFSILQSSGASSLTNSSCNEDDNRKHLMFSHPGREVICVNLDIPPDNRTYNLGISNYVSAQLIDVKGSLTSSLKFSQLLKFLFIYKSQIYSISLELPKGTHLHIAESILPTIRANTFKSQIYTLGFHSNPNLVFEDNCFSNLRVLKTLILYNQSISMEKRNLFSGLKNLTTLVINKNSLFNIDENTFKDLTSLTTLNLDFNGIEILRVIHFSCLPNLKTLSLLYSNIQTVSLPVFKPLRNLETLKLPQSILKSLIKKQLSEMALSFPNLNVVYFEIGYPDREFLENMKSTGLKIYQLNVRYDLLRSKVFDVSTISY